MQSYFFKPKALIKAPPPAFQRGSPEPRVVVEHYEEVQHSVS
jgi:hypothetical protein